MQLIDRLKEHSGTALIDDHQSLSYSQLVLRAELIAKQLAAQNVVALVMNNSIASIVDYLACLIAKAPVILLSDEAQIEQYRIFSANYLLHENKVTKLHTCDVCDLTHPDLCLLLSTSGSTGSPKMVRLSRQNLDANTASITEYLKLDTQARSITSLPLTYSFGLSILHSYLWSGASLVVTQLGITDKAFWFLMKEHHVTSLSGVPFHFETLRRLRFFNMSLSSLKVFTQAGGKLREDVLEEFAKHCQANDQRFYVMYGQTEAAPRIAYLPPDQLLAKLGSIGVAVPGGMLSLIDESGQEIAGKDKEGELVYQGENVMMGYAKDRDDLRLGHGDRILYTGDLAKRDMDGYYYITGRKSRFIKMQGKRLSLAHIEETLASYGAIENACIGHEDKLVVVFSNEDDRSIIELYLKELNVHPTFYQLLKLPIIPRTQNGKVDYSGLNRRLSGDE